MDAPPNKGEDVRPFIQIARYLRGIGLSAPDILAEDAQNGFLLLEDLGDDLFARVVEREPELEDMLYTAATDVLVDLHKADLPHGISAYNADLMANLAALAFDWYEYGIKGTLPENAKAKFIALFEPMLDGLDGLSEVLIQRDYHAENLLWLPERDDVARVGLLDFQDAMSGHRAYDLISLLQDARRDVSPDIEAAMVDRYLSQTDCDPDDFRRAYALLGLQRNLRIIGVFARLCIRDGKAHYVDLIPRVWDHMMRDLQAINAAELVSVIEDELPLPTGEALSVLRQKCGMIQQPS